jgi:hypothetical protein
MELKAPDCKRSWSADSMFWGNDKGGLETEENNPRLPT